MRYDRVPLVRFLVLALPLLVLVLGVGTFGVEVFGLVPRSGATELPARVLLLTWVMESVGLIALFLLIRGRSFNGFFDGLLTGSVAWIFRGPLLVVMMVGVAGRSQELWWSLALGWWITYTVCGLLLAWLARASDKRSEAAGGGEGAETGRSGTTFAP